MSVLALQLEGRMEELMSTLGHVGRGSLLYTGILVSAGILGESAFAREDAHTKAMRGLLAAPPSSESWNDDVSGAFLLLRTRKDPPVCVLAEIILPLCAQAGMTADHPLMPPLLMAIVLGGVPSALPYHNHHHIREVTALATTLALAAYGSGAPELVAELVIAACLHDFAHDGQGNRSADTHAPMRLEARALEKAAPYMKAAGLPDELWVRISAMILATDVSKADAKGVSPADLLRMACAGREAPSACPEGLRPLFNDMRLAAQASFLEDADLGTSAAMPYTHARRMSALVAEETRVLTPTPQTLIGFLDHICRGTFISPQARAIFGDNIATIRAQAEKDDTDTLFYWS